MKPPFLSLLAILTVLFPFVTGANIYNVTGTADGLGTVTGGPTVFNVTTLRTAITVANGAAGAHTINLPAGIYNLNSPGVVGTGELQVGTASGADITFSGAGAAFTIIHQSNSGFRVFDLDPSVVGNVAVTIQNLTISGGYAQAFGGGAILGGGAGDNLVLTGVTISANFAPGLYSAAGISWSPAGNVRINNCTFSNNSSGQSAGAILYTGTGTLGITNSTFTGNTAAAAGSAGGALLLGLNGAGPAIFNVFNCTFTGNQAFSPTGIGGAIYLGGGTLNASYNRFVGNTAPFGGGVGVRGGTANATNNWWGCNGGPGSAGCNTTDNSGGTLNFNPWLQLRHAANPRTIIVSNSTTLTATFQTNSANAYVNPANLAALIGRPISFSGPVLGSVSGAGTTIGAGATATATYTATNGGVGSVNATVDNQTTIASITNNQSPQINCPGNITTNTATGSCSRTVALSTGVTAGYPPPIASYKLGGTNITSPFAFPRGTNVVQVIATNGVAPDVSCSFTVIVNDTQAPSSVCSTNITITAAGNCPTVVNFIISGSDNCSIGGVVANPPSGFAFPVGTNTVIVTATDASGNTNSCSFQIAVLAGPPPMLSIANINTNAVLSWPVGFGCYSLQHSPTLLSQPSSNAWTIHPGPFTTNVGNLYVTNVLGMSNRFFRLAF